MRHSSLREFIEGHAGSEFVLLLGAGASVTAGIPTAAGIVADLPRRFQHLESVRIDPQDDYYAAVSRLTAPDRRSLFATYSAEARINVASLVAARLLFKKRLAFVITTNFDDLIPRSASLNVDSIPIYDATLTTLQEGFHLFSPAIVYLHGQVHGFWQLNTLEEHNVYADTIRHFVKSAITDRSVIVVGYSGLDPLFPILVEELASARSIAWVPFRGMAIEGTVADKLGETKHAALVEDIVDADQALYNIGNQLAVLDEYNSRFFIDMLHKLSSVQSTVRLGDSEVDVISVSKDKISLAKDLYEDKAVQVTRVNIERAHGSRYTDLVHLLENVDQRLRTLHSVLPSFPSEAASAFATLLRDAGRTCRSPSLLRKSTWWAELLWDESPEAASAIGLLLATNYSEIGRWEHDVSCLEKAARFYRATVEVAPTEERRLACLNGWAVSRHDIALEYGTSEPPDLKLARQYFDEATVLFEQVTRSKKAHGKACSNHSSMLIDMARVLGDHHRLQDAEVLARRAEKLTHGAGAYNIACCRALQGDADEALEWMERALSSRNHPREQFEQDPDLSGIRHHPRFLLLLDKYRG